MIERILSILAAFVIWVISSTGYLGIMILMAIESACIPLPSEVIMPFSGYLVYTGRFSLFWVATWGAIGCNVGSVFAYEVGFYGGRPLIEKYGRYILLSARELAWADRFFRRYGGSAVFIARLLPVIRTFIALPAGIARMPRLRFHVYTFLGSWPWCFGLAYLGMKLGENWRTLGKYFHQFDVVIGVLLALGLAWFVWSHWKHRVGAGKQEHKHEPEVISAKGVR
jgi:membrane protein DedA with SNARE-associated domain